MGKNIDIEKIKQTFFDDNVIIPQQEPIFRIDSKGSRYYLKIDGDKHIIKPSVTSVIKRYHPMNPYLLKWWCDVGYERGKEILAETSIYGTLIHILFAKLLLRFNLGTSEYELNQEIQKLFEKENRPWIYDLTKWCDNIRQDLLGFIQWVQDYKVKPIFIEMTLHGEDFAGTLDLGCEITQNIYNKSTKEYDEIIKKIIVDWKSNRNDFYEDNIIQLDGYFDLANKTFPGMFEEVWNYGCKNYRLPIGKSVTPYRFVNQTEQPGRKRWKHYLAMYLEEEPEATIESRTEIIDTYVNIGIDINDCIQTIDPLEFLKEDDNAEEQKSSDADNRQD